jgi:16S rRNA (adenine1518-N6/adenine1519-N6)-dimethyltransferase
MSSTRQTASFLKRRFREAGLKPDVRHGQNFLIDLNLLDLLVRTADVGPDDLVLEVGTGTGSLTARLAQTAAAVITVERDPRLYELAADELADCTNVTMLRRDALKNKNHLHPEVLAAVREQLAVGPNRRFKLVANLPYNIATPVVSNLLVADPVPVSMTVTIQKELAERIAARPGTKDYSALSVWVQCQCDVEIVRLMPPTAFWPRPKVHSAIVHVVARPERRRRIDDVVRFHALVRSLFLHRRKVLRGVLSMVGEVRLEKSEVDRILKRLGIAPTARAEQLDVETLLALSRQVG